MVFTSARYYNNSSNITALLVKISNRMIVNCRSYINENGTKTVWNQKKQIVMDKIKICLDLYMKYYQCFKRIRREMTEAGEKPLDCSEMYVFMKFETFKVRLEQVIYSFACLHFCNDFLS